MKILAVVTNYARPRNVIQIAKRLTCQPGFDVVIVDNAPGQSIEGIIEHEIGVSHRIRDFFRWRINSGPPCRFAPALMLTDYEYVLLVDDDLLPTANCYDVCRRLIDITGGKFASIGQIGRRHNDDGQYVKRNVTGPRGQLVPVDITCRMHLVKRNRLWAAMQMQALVQETVEMTQSLREHLWEDDIFLNHGIQTFYGLPSYILPRCHPDHKLIETNLGDGVAGGGHSMSSRPDHVTIRQRVIDIIKAAGWKSKTEGAALHFYS